jgi:MSHA biogenesis protein MshI
MVGLTIAERELTLAYMLPGTEGRPVLEHVESVRLENAAQAPELLAEMVDEYDLKGANTTAVLEAGSYNLMHVDRPAVEDSELRNAVKWRIKDLISYPVEEAVVDVYSIPNLEDRVRAANWIYAVVAREASIQELVNTVRGTGLNLHAIDIPEFCLRNLVARDPEAQASTGILHITSQEALLILIRAEIMYLTRGFDVGYGDVIRADEPSENGGLSLGGLPPAHEQSLLEIQRSLDYFDSHFGQAHVSRLMVLPDDSLLQSFIDMLSSNSSLRVEPFRVDSVLDLSDSVDPRSVGPAVLAIGASLRSMEVSA